MTRLARSLFVLSALPLVGATAFTQGAPAAAGAPASAALTRLIPGTMLVSGSEIYTAFGVEGRGVVVSAHEAGDGAELWSAPIVTENDAVDTLDLTPDGKQLYAMSRPSVGVGTGVLFRVDVATQQRTTVTRIPDLRGPVLAALAPNGRRMTVAYDLVQGSSTPVLLRINLRTGVQGFQNFTLDPRAELFRVPRGIVHAWTNTNDSIESNNVVFLMDPYEEMTIWGKSLAGSTHEDVAATADGSLIATTGRNFNHGEGFVDYATAAIDVYGQFLWRSIERGRWVAVDPGGTRVVVLRADNLELRCHEAQTGAELWRVPLGVDVGSPQRLEIDPTGSHIVIAGERIGATTDVFHLGIALEDGATLWDETFGSQLVDDRPYDLGFTPSGDPIIAVEDAGLTTFVFDVQQLAVRWLVRHGASL